MSVRPRDAKVFAALLVSMMIGGIVLMTLGNNPPQSGAFCLSGYYHLDPIEQVIVSRAAQSPDRWNRIEICYSGTESGNVEQLASYSGLTSTEDIDYHFVICNGIGAADGQIEPTEKWQRQLSIMPNRGGDNSSRIIRICIISDGKTSPPTDYQIKRKDALVEGLLRKFNINPGAIYGPNNWQ